MNQLKLCASRNRTNTLDLRNKEHNNGFSKIDAKLNGGYFIAWIQEPTT